MTNVLNDLERLALIRAELPLGAQKAIAEKLSVTPAAIAYVLSGKRKSPKLRAGIFRWYLDWVATQPAPLPPVDVTELDQALNTRLNPLTK